MSNAESPTRKRDTDLDTWFDRRFEEKMAERDAARTPGMTAIATKGTLDMAYPPFILASTAAALGWDVSIFFTFYGLSLLKRELDLKVTPLGNPAMPLKLPAGPTWLKGKELPVPTSLKALLPGFQDMASNMMRKTMDTPTRTITHIFGGHRYGTPPASVGRSSEGGSADRYGASRRAVAPAATRAPCWCLASEWRIALRASALQRGSASCRSVGMARLMGKGMTSHQRGGAASDRAGWR